MGKSGFKYKQKGGELGLASSAMEVSPRHPTEQLKVWTPFGESS
jgi:hypothetical protein